MTNFTQQDIEIAWAAGFFDGEGCFTSRKNGTSNKRYPAVRISQAHPEVLERFKKAVGYGQIHGPYYPKDKTGAMWSYNCASTGEVREVCKKIGPLLGTLKTKDMLFMLEGCKDIGTYKKVNRI